MSIISKPIQPVEIDEMFFVTINGYTNYKVNPDGKVINVKTNKELKPALNKNGYYYVCLCKNGIKKIKTIHKLVAETFLFNDDNLPDVNHINNIKTDNRIENLEFASIEANNRNKLKHFNVNYTFVNEIPTDSLHITFIKDNDISNTGLYFNKNTDQFYLRMTNNKYKIMHKNLNGKSYTIQFRFNNKQINYSPKQLKRDYNDYFK